MAVKVCIIISFLYMYLSVRFHYLSSSRSVVVSQPEDVRVRQDLGVSSPPQIIFSSMLWKNVGNGRSGS